MKTTLNHLSALSAVVLMSLALPVHAGTTSYYIYDESGHVIGEYDANGNSVQEHIYLGDRPVAVVTGGSSGGGTVDYVTTDQLNTPRVITDSSQAVLWSWNSDPFGNGNPTGSMTYDLRFPGQQYDSETGHNYNYYRDYDSSTGRYIESDPVGLYGDLNGYAYVVDNSLIYSDPYGLYHCVGNANCGGFTSALEQALHCMDNCTGLNLAITSGTDSHGPNDPHSRGQAVDIGRNSNPCLTREKAEDCFMRCFDTRNSFAQEEQNLGPGTHFHIQVTPGLHGSVGFRPGIAPHGH